MVSILPLTLVGGVVKKRGKRVLGPVDLTVSERGFTIVLGPNGSGKTTLLRTLHGLERLREGRLDWQVPLARARARQAFVFQTPIMLRRSVIENLAYPLRVSGVARAESEARAKDWAARVGLAGALEVSAPRLSGGERQKLALARALIRTPDILYLDEPCANLDGQATREIEAILIDVEAQGVRILMSTHDVGQARRLASDVVFLMGGQVIEQGPAQVFFKKPATRQAEALLRGDIVE
jgi:tungstate transport system ATP-binding protein